jgi:hypothetical protein
MLRVRPLKDAAETRRRREGSWRLRASAVKNTSTSLHNNTMSNSPKDLKCDNRWLKFFKKWHRWPGLIMGLFFVLWAISGIVMNHRKLVSGLDISRNCLPKEYRYVNWNNAAVRSAVNIGKDSILVYGNIGIWLTDSSFGHFTDFNNGFPKGIDNRKISCLLSSPGGNLYAGTLFGVFYFDFSSGKWIKLDIPSKDQRIQWFSIKDGKLLILTRSELLQADDDPVNFRAFALPLPPPEGYDNKAGLFRTIWVIHSGEIYGNIGKLIVDLLGFIVIFLAITGVLHFSMPYALRWLKKRQKPIATASATKRFSAKWHKKLGIWIAAFVLINTVTGMFLRPPLLITIATAKVGKIPLSVLDSPNPWADKLRAIIYDDGIGGFLFGTSEGLFYADKDLQSEMTAPPVQPPLSVMGINVFQKESKGTYLVGTFNGLYDWMPQYGIYRDHITGKILNKPGAASKPFGDEMAAGYWVSGSGEEIYFDYNYGARILGDQGEFVPMPPEILEKSPMSWWNFALEVHTARIFKSLIGDFYILIVPLMGIFGTILVISGLVVWARLYIRRRRSVATGLKPAS